MTCDHLLREELCFLILAICIINLNDNGITKKYINKYRGN